MANSSQFDAYEYISVISPGAVLLVGIGVALPFTRSLLGHGDITLGDLGIFVIIAYVVGQLLQALAALLERTLWAISGWPTDWPIMNAGKLLGAQRESQLVKALNFKTSTPELTEWHNAIRETYARLQAAGRTQRIDAFNRTYGLFKALVICFLLLAALALWQERSGLGTALLVVLAVVSLQRMYGFGLAYARELFAQFFACAGDRHAGALGPVHDATE